MRNHRAFEMTQERRDRLMAVGLTEWEYDVITQIQPEVLVNIYSVSQSGMTRRMKFYGLRSWEGQAQCINITHILADIMGDKIDKNGCIKVEGCGMDMVFHYLSSFNYRMAKLVEGQPLNVLIEGKKFGNVYDDYWLDAENCRRV